MQKRNHKKEKDVNLGAVELPLSKFDNLSATFKEFKTKEFRSLNEQQKNERVNRILLDLIQKTPTPCFLLPAVLDYIDGVDALKMMESYSFLHFELYLNQFSGLTWEENLFVRGKIAGKWLPRDTFQLLFPIGMGKIYSGSHYVTAHSSPDLDTTVASFWGWIDAFTARVGQGLHVWNVPGGVATSQTEIQLLFKEIFGENVFRHLAKTRTTLALCGVDLMTQQGMMRKELYAPFHDIDYERGQNALVLVDEQGYYVGDWSSFDVEAVREVIALFNSCLRWFATHLHLKLVSLFSKERVSVKDLPTFIDSIFLMSIQESEPFREFSHKQKQYLDCYLKDVLDVKKGIESTFEELAKKLKTLSLYALQECFDMLNSLHELTIFDRSGLLVENRPRLFLMIEKIIAAMEKAIQDMRTYVDRLEIALKRSCISV